MKQLSGFDNYFLTSEVGNTYNHIAALAIYDQGTAPGGVVRFKNILRHMESQLTAHPLFYRRVLTPPMGLDNAYWVDLPPEDIDIEFHVRHVALPQPGDWRQLMIQVARLHSRPLDRSRPLWEVYVIEGLKNIPHVPSNAFAVLFKFHHASLDGMAAGRLIFQMHSATPDLPDARGPAAPAPRARALSRVPGDLELFARTGLGIVQRVSGLSRMYLGGLQRLTASAKESSAALAVSAGKGASVEVAASGNSLPKLIGQVLGSVAGAIPALQKMLVAFTQNVAAPKTRFSGTLSANRVMEAVALPLADINTLRSRVPGITINDVFVAVVGGALRRYLAEKNELPKESLLGLMPIDIRGEVAENGGNHIGGVPVPLHSEIADPLKRLHAVHTSIQRAKEQAELVGRDMLFNLLNLLPSYLAQQFMKRVVMPQLNTTISNVRGPDASFYLSGAKLLHMYPASIPLDGVGLNNTGISYNGVFWIAAVACRRMMPDPEFYADCLRQSFAELLAASADAAAVKAVVAEPAKAAKKPATRRAPTKAKAATKAAPGKPAKSAPAAKKKMKTTK